MKKVIAFTIAVFLTTPVFAKKHTIEEVLAQRTQILVSDSRNTYIVQHTCNLDIEANEKVTVASADRVLRKTSRIRVTTENDTQVCRVTNLQIID